MAEITVVVPVYNEEKGLRRCVNSVLAQTFKDWELILVDDGSTDKSPEICEEFAKSDKRIRVIRQQNKGYSGARNTGIAAAEGKYIIFVDGDDWAEPDALEKGYRGMEENGVDLVFGGAHFRIFDGDKLVETFGGAPEEDFIFRMKDFNTFGPKLWDINATMFYCAWSKLYRTDIIRYNGLRFDENLFVQEDVKFAYCYYYCCDKCMAAKGYFYNYCRPVGKDDVGEKPQIDQYQCVEQSLISFLRMAFKFNYPEDYRLLMYEKTSEHFVKLSGKIYMEETGLSVSEQKAHVKAMSDCFAFRFFAEKLSERDPFWKKMGEFLADGEYDGIYEEWGKKLGEGVVPPCT